MKNYIRIHQYLHYQLVKLQLEIMVVIHLILYHRMVMIHLVYIIFMGMYIKWEMLIIITNKIHLVLNKLVRGFYILSTIFNQFEIEL